MKYLLLLMIPFFLCSCDKRSKEAITKKANQVNVAKKNVQNLNLQMKTEKKKILPVDPR